MISLLFDLFIDADFSRYHIVQILDKHHTCKNLTNLITQSFVFVLTERNNSNNLEIKTILLYKINTIQSNNNQNKSNNPKTNPTTMLKI